MSVRAVFAAYNYHYIRFFRKFNAAVLPVFGRAAYGIPGNTFRRLYIPADLIKDFFRNRCLSNNKYFVRCYFRCLLRCFCHYGAVAAPAVGTCNLRMISVSRYNYCIAVIMGFFNKGMYFFNKRTCGINKPYALCLRFFVEAFRLAVRAYYNRGIASDII